MAYEHTSVGVMDAVKLNKFVIKIDNLSYEVLIDKINQVWVEREEIKNVLKRQMNVIRKLSLVNSIIALALVDCTIQHTIHKKGLKEEIDKLMTDFQQGRLPL